MIYQLIDGKYVDLSKVITMELQHFDYFGVGIVYCEHFNKSITFRIEDDNNFNSTIDAREQQKKRIEDKFKIVIDAWIRNNEMEKRSE